MEIMHRVSDFQNYQIFSDNTAEGTKQESANTEPIEKCKNSLIVFWQWRRDDHAK